MGANGNGISTAPSHSISSLPPTPRKNSIACRSAFLQFYFYANKHQHEWMASPRLASPLNWYSDITKKKPTPPPPPLGWGRSMGLDSDLGHCRSSFPSSSSFYFRGNDCSTSSSIQSAICHDTSHAQQPPWRKAIANQLFISGVIIYKYLRPCGGRPRTLAIVTPTYAADAIELNAQT